MPGIGFAAISVQASIFSPCRQSQLVPSSNGSSVRVDLLVFHFSLVSVEPGRAPSIHEVLTKHLQDD